MMKTTSRGEFITLIFRFPGVERKRERKHTITILRWIEARLPNEAIPNHTHILGKYYDVSSYISPTCSTSIKLISNEISELDTTTSSKLYRSFCALAQDLSRLCTAEWARQQHTLKTHECHALMHQYRPAHVSLTTHIFGEHFKKDVKVMLSTIMLCAAARVCESVCVCVQSSLIPRAFHIGSPRSPKSTKRTVNVSWVNMRVSENREAK